MLVVDFDGGSLRAEPPVQLVAAIHDWCDAAFRSAGANPVVGTRLALLLREAGAVDISTLGVQTYLGPEDPHGPLWAAGLVNSLALRIIADGIATEAELGLHTLRERVARELAARDAIFLPPTVVGAWGRRPHRLVDDRSGRAPSLHARNADDP